MIGDEVVVKNGRLETKWTVRDNITIAECLEINTHMNRPGVRGFDFKDMSVSTRKGRQDDSEDNTNDDSTVWHPRISPFNEKKEQTRREKKKKKRKRAPRALSFNSNDVRIEDALTKHLTLFQMFWPEIREINYIKLTQRSQRIMKKQ